MSFFSRGGEGEDAEEEEELEEEDDEEDLQGWGTSLGWTGGFSLSLSRCASLCLPLSCSLLSRESERLVLLRRCGEGERRDLIGGLGRLSILDVDPLRLLGLLDRDLLRLLGLLDLLLLIALSCSLFLSLSLSLCLSLSRSDQAGGGEALLDRGGGS